MPWLRIKGPCRLAGVDFLPWRKGKAVLPALADCSDALSAILSGYVDRRGKPIESCVVITIPDRGWNLADGDYESVRWAASLLFLNAWASNEYYVHPEPYVNSSFFRVVWQRFTGAPDWIALTSRRRDGRSIDGGYKHGEVRFSAPLQCSLRDVVVDEAVRAGLDKAHGAASDTIKRLRYALPFVELANTDDDTMTETAEAILMGSAFEQALRVKGAYELGRAFADLFRSFGSVTVAAARDVRPGIRIDESRPDRAAAQPKWWVHQKWIEELHGLRSKSVHEGTSAGVPSGWIPLEHLVMAAWVFPLVVKLFLQRDGHYQLTDADTGRCLSVDKLLVLVGWAEDEGGVPRWHKVLSNTQHEHLFRQLGERASKWLDELQSREDTGDSFVR